MIRRLLHLVIVFIVVIASMSLVNPPAAQALSGKEIDTTYYDQCMDPIYERVIGCFGEVYTWGESSAGAVYKNISTLECEGSGYTSTWYEWNGSSWVILPGMPSGC